MLNVLSFKGGIHPLEKIHHGKPLTEKQPITPAQPPKTVAIPLLQHIGAPCLPLVKPGDLVKLGQRIGEPGGRVSSPVHASVSGKVLAVEPRLVVKGNTVNCVIIENDGKDTLDESIRPIGELEKLDRAAILKAIGDAGVVGMGGAAFPYQVKLDLPEGTVVNSLILNGAECEPFLTTDNRTMLEAPEDVVNGLRAVMKVVGVDKAYVGIEVNKPDAIAAMEKACAPYPGIEVKALKVKYPQGAKKQLIYAITGKEAPAGRSSAAGVILCNVTSVATIARVLRTGMPVVTQAVTVTGSVKKPANLLARVGTSFQDLIDQCGGTLGEPAQIISGGPMMGHAVFDTTVPVTKGSGGILVLDQKLGRHRPEMNCILCGRCAEHCPMFLQPMLINAAAVCEDFKKAEALDAMECMECGCCSYICPSNRNLVQSIRLCKNEIKAARAAAKKK